MTGIVDGSMPAPLSAAIAPPAVPSLAARTPWKPSLPSAVIAWSISFWAFSGSQSGVSYSLATSMPFSWNTAVAPSLNNFALLSFGSPLIWTIGPVGLPSSVEALRERLALLLADLRAVELGVGGEVGVEDQPVIADHRDVRLLWRG